MKEMSMREMELRQAQIIAGAINEIAATSNEPNDRPYDYPEAAINLTFANLTKVIEGCTRRAAQA